MKTRTNDTPEPLSVARRRLAAILADYDQPAGRTATIQDVRYAIAAYDAAQRGMAPPRRPMPIVQRIGLDGTAVTVNLADPDEW